jgi:hypothetical protein
MKVKMEDLLPGIRAGVDQGAVSGSLYPFGSGHLTGTPMDMGEELHPGLVQLVEGGHMGFGYHEHVDRGHRMDVLERQHMFIFVDFNAGFPASDDLAEDAFHG